MSVTVNIPSKIPLKYQPTVFVFTRNSRISTCNPRVSHFIAPKSNGFKKLRFINAINLLARNHVLLNRLIREFSHLMFALSRAWTIMRALKGAIWRCLDRPKRCNNRSQWKRPKNTFLTSHLCDWRRSATFSKLPTCCDSFFSANSENKQEEELTTDSPKTMPVWCVIIIHSAAAGVNNNACDRPSTDSLRPAPSWKALDGISR